MKFLEHCAICIPINLESHFPMLCSYDMNAHFLEFAAGNFREFPEITRKLQTLPLIYFATRVLLSTVLVGLQLSQWPFCGLRFVQNVSMFWMNQYKNAILVCVLNYVGWALYFET